MPAFNQSYAVNGLNQYTSVAGVTYGYDPRGNLSGDGARSFSYDLENHLTSVAEGGATRTLSYDPLGRLRSIMANSVTTEFLYDGDRLVAEYDPSRAAGNQLLRRYVHGAGVDEPIVWYECPSPTPGACTGNRNWLIADRQGSIIASTDAAGAASIYRYGPYGEPEGGNWTGQRFRYTGQIALPELRLYYYKARVYDPYLGRFLQTDPIGFTADLDLYSYAGDDPVNNDDPTGLASSDCGSRVGTNGNQGASSCSSYGTPAAWETPAPGLLITDRRSFRIDLTEHEGRGHTITEHVGMSDQELITTMRRPIRIIVTPTATHRFYRQRLSTFPSVAAANRLVSSTLSQHSQEIADYLRSGSTANLTMLGRFGTAPTGRVAIAGGISVGGMPRSISVQDGHGVMVTIRAAPSMPNGFLIVTAFPTVEQ